VKHFKKKTAKKFVRSNEDDKSAIGSVIMIHVCLPTSDTVETQFRPDHHHGFVWYVVQ
jgi:hypothetical protein